jgi:micrococcal nuclease
LGIASRDYLRSLLNTNPNKLIVVERDRDKYGRVVAEIYIPRGRGDEEIPINAMMINSGNAYYYSQYSKNCAENAKIYTNLQKEAQEKKIGVWKYNGLKPWEYRKANR